MIARPVKPDHEVKQVVCRECPSGCQVIWGQAVRPGGKNGEGVSAVLEYMITFVIAFILFTIMLTMFGSMFIDGPTKVVSGIQFADVGNDIAAKMIDTYLVAPTDGSVKTRFDMPVTVAGSGYTVKVEPINSNDVEVEVYSVTSGISRKITINGVHSTIHLNGITTSLSDTHWVWYQSV